VKRLLVLGAGTAGTMAVNKLHRKLDGSQWQITVVEQGVTHYYQPGYLFLPFGSYRPDQVRRPVARFLPHGVELIRGEIDGVDADEQTVMLADGRRLPYDFLVIATGTSPRPDQTPGMAGDGWGVSIHDFYTFDGATRLAERLRTWPGGRLVVHIAEMPIKCPVAPLEFTFLADAFFADRGMRDRVALSYVTPLSGAFTKPVASARLGDMLTDRKVELQSDFMVERIDPDAKTLWSYDDRAIAYDLLVTVPVNMGADFVGRSGLGDELNYVQVDKHTLQSRAHQNIFALGDAADVPASKAGSVAHFEVELFTRNFIDLVAGRPMTARFDGHANCFIESGRRKGLLIDFNYDTEPLPGTFPLPRVGPFSLLKETGLNHRGKLAFRWLYWNVMLRGHELPVPTLMSMTGKHSPEHRSRPGTGTTTEAGTTTEGGQPCPAPRWTDIRSRSTPRDSSPSTTNGARNWPECWPHRSAST
jgi:sulfide:quinone oxidoreductase